MHTPVRKMTSCGLLLAAAFCNAMPEGSAQAQQTSIPTTSAEAPEMRSRLLTSLTGYEVQQYLDRNDVLFIPVGPTEISGNRPLDAEYVIPLAYALELAKKADGLVLPNVSYIDPGSTISHPSTVQTSARQGIEYLTSLMRSALRQGFRRIVLITSHGPAFHTVVPAQDEIFYETHISSIWIEPGLISGTRPGAPRREDTPQPDPAVIAAERAATVYGAYEIAGRLDDLPVGLSEPPRDFERNAGLERLGQILGGIWNGKVPAYFADGSQHGGFVTPVTAEQRSAWGTQGADRIRKEVAAFDVNGMLDALRDHNVFTSRQAERLGEALPGPATRIKPQR